MRRMLLIGASLACLALIVAGPGITRAQTGTKSREARLLGSYISADFPPDFYDEVSNRDFAQSYPELAQEIVDDGRITGIETAHVNLADGHGNGLLDLHLFDSPDDALTFLQAWVDAEAANPADLSRIRAGNSALGDAGLVIFQRGRVVVIVQAIGPGPDAPPDPSITTSLNAIAGAIDARISANPPSRS